MQDKFSLFRFRDVLIALIVAFSINHSYSIQVLQ
jgi:hypothetical protein